MTTFFTLLLGFAGSSYGQDFEETKLLAEQGDATAQNNLGLMYANGEGVPENDVEAVKLYRLAAEQGYAPAQNNLGVMYEKGEGAATDCKEASLLFKERFCL
ncbi:MAG: tetratricopeptide repeat protein [Pseudomonadales bacterium]